MLTCGLGVRAVSSSTLVGVSGANHSSSDSGIWSDRREVARNLAEVPH